MPRNSERSLAIRPIDLIYSVRELRGGRLASPEPCLDAVFAAQCFEIAYQLH